MTPVREQVFNEVRCPVRDHLYDKAIMMKTADWYQALDIALYKVQDQVIDWNLVWNKLR